MDIQVGRFILKSDMWTYWIEEEYEGEDKKGKTKLMTRRVTGYCTSLESLYRSFTEHRHKASEATTMTQLIREMQQTLADITAIKKSAAENDFKMLRKTAKTIKEINKDG